MKTSTYACVRISPTHSLAIYQPINKVPFEENMEVYTLPTLFHPV